MSEVFFASVTARVDLVVFRETTADVFFDLPDGGTSPTVFKVSHEAGHLWARLIGKSVVMKAFSPGHGVNAHLSKGETP